MWWWGGSAMCNARPNAVVLNSVRRPVPSRNPRLHATLPASAVPPRPRPRTPMRDGEALPAVRGGHVGGMSPTAADARVW